jgi:hypothetical protein
LKKYRGPERRTGKLRMRIVEILGRVLSDHLQFSKDIILTQDLFNEVNQGLQNGDRGFTPFENFFRELHTIASAKGGYEPICKTAKYVFDRSHHLSKKEHLNRRERRKGFLREKAEDLLYDVINGMDILDPHKSWAESFFIALSERVQKDDGVILSEEDYANVLRELDSLLPGFDVMAIFIRTLQRDLGSGFKEEFRDKRLEEQKPIEDFRRFLVSN